MRKDGNRVPVLIGSVRLFDSQRHHAITFVLDLTQRKRAEAEARDSESRYREIQSELAHANRLDTMGQLTASIAHEVNQPITGVSATARAALRWLANEPPAVEKARNSLERIVRDADRATNVIGRIRALVKKAPPRNESFNIGEAIREVVGLTNSEALNKQIAVKTHLSEDLPLIQGDRVQLQQVLLNLIVNAIQAMAAGADGGRDLLVTVAPTEPNGVLVAVADSLGARSGEPRARFRSFLHHQAERLGHRPFNLPVHHRCSRRTVVGKRQPTSWRCISVHAPGARGRTIVIAPEAAAQSDMQSNAWHNEPLPIKARLGSFGFSLLLQAHHRNHGRRGQLKRG